MYYRELNNNFTDRGVAIIELLICLPVLLILVFVGSDIAIALNKYQIALSLSKDLATIVYRECVIDINSYQYSSMRTDGYYSELLGPPECVKKLNDSKMKTAVAKISSDAGYALSMYNWRSFPRSPLRTAIALHNVPASRYSINNFRQGPSADTDVSGNTSKLLKDYEVVVIAEVFIPHQTLFPGIMNSLHFKDNMVYAATLY